MCLHGCLWGSGKGTPTLLPDSQTLIQSLHLQQDLHEAALSILPGTCGVGPQLGPQQPRPYSEDSGSGSFQHTGRDLKLPDSPVPCLALGPCCQKGPRISGSSWLVPSRGQRPIPGTPAGPKAVAQSQAQEALRRECGMVLGPCVDRARCQAVHFSNPLI